MKQIIRNSIVALLVVFASLSGAYASLVTWSFSGEITSVYDDWSMLDGSVSVGTVFSGTLAYDSLTPDSAFEDPSVGWYEFSALQGGRIQANFGNYELETKQLFRTVVYLGSPFNPWPTTYTHTYASSNLGGFRFSNGVDTFDPKGPFEGADGIVGFDIHDYSGSIITSDEIPFPSISLQALDVQFFTIEYYEFLGVDREIVNLVRITGEANQFSINQELSVSEPTAKALIGLSLLALIAWGRLRTAERVERLGLSSSAV